MYDYVYEHKNTDRYLLVRIPMLYYDQSADDTFEAILVPYTKELVFVTKSMYEVLHESNMKLKSKGLNNCNKLTTCWNEYSVKAVDYVEELLPKHISNKSSKFSVP